MNFKKGRFESEAVLILFRVGRVRSVRVGSDETGTVIIELTQLNFK